MKKIKVTISVDSDLLEKAMEGCSNRSNRIEFLMRLGMQMEDKLEKPDSKERHES